MKNDINEIGFRLNQIEKKQFATLGDVPAPSSIIHENIEFAFGVLQEEKIIGCLFHYTLLGDGDKPFLTIQVSCDFKINQENWQQLAGETKSDIKLPKGFAQHLAGITVGTARGILHNETENTPFNEYPVGLINLKDIFTDDAVIDLQE